MKGIEAMTPVETVLRLCQSAEPEPWYPRVYFRDHEISRDSLDPVLDELRMAGFIELTPWVAGPGQGYRLTPSGRALLANPRAMERMDRGGPAPEVKVVESEESFEHHANTDRWLQVKDAVLTQQPARVSLVLGGACVAFFVWGLMLASRDNAESAFLAGFLGGDPAKFSPILDRTGSVNIKQVMEGEWWRLLTAAFVHIGLLHLVVNMYALRVLGPMTERMYGHWRFLLVYLIAAVGGSAVGIFFQSSSGMAGASGAICGLLGAIASWNILNRRYLPPRFYRSQMSWLIQNVVLLALISLAPGVSWSGHLGGAVFGFIAGALLTVNRFGAVFLRIPTLIAALIVGILCIVGFKPVVVWAGKCNSISYLPRNSSLTENEEIDSFNSEVVRKVGPVISDSDSSVQEHIDPLFKHPNVERDIKSAVETLEQQIDALTDAEKIIDGAGPYQSDRLNEARAALLERIQTRIALLERMRKALKVPDAASDRKDIQTLRQRVEAAEERYEKVKRVDKPK
jgi:membrane associated rhomboid family serine protease